MNTGEIKGLFSYLAANTGRAVSRESVDAWVKLLSADTFTLDAAQRALDVWLAERDDPRSSLTIPAFMSCYRRVSRQLKSGYTGPVVGCKLCEGSGYLHHVYGTNAMPAKPLDEFRLVFALVDVAHAKPHECKRYRLCGIPCPDCSLGRAELDRWCQHPGGYPAPDEVSRLQSCGLSPSIALAWLAYLSQGDAGLQRQLAENEARQSTRRVPARKAVDITEPRHSRVSDDDVAAIKQAMEG